MVPEYGQSQHSKKPETQGLLGSSATALMIDVLEAQELSSSTVDHISQSINQSTQHLEALCTTEGNPPNPQDWQGVTVAGNSGSASSEGPSL